MAGEPNHSKENRPSGLASRMPRRLIGLKRRTPLLGISALVAILGHPGWADTFPVLSPNGPVAATQRQLMLEALGMMAIVVLPVFLLTAYFVYRFRASRNPRNYDPNWESGRVDFVVWLIPALIVVVIAFLQWTRTHSLDPYKSPDGALQIEAIALDWKWLFLYPDAGVASLNELVVPAGQPFQVKLTSDTVMNSFFIPGLGGQIYAMAGMETRMNLTADAPAEMWGRNTQFSGEGFPDQRFAVNVVDQAAYDEWIASARTEAAMDTGTYADLQKPSSDVAAVQYSAFPDDLFATVMASYGHHAMSEMK